MKISYNWLKQYIKTDIAINDMAQMLTDCGLEVESIETFQTIKGGLKGFVIGEVKSKEKHPDADRLSITTVDVGGDELLNIVCGAPNVDVNQKVVVATIGTIIYSEKGDFEIKKSKIRGAASEGMICAEDEMGIGHSHDGILVLPAEAKTGTPANEYFKIEDDFIFEIGLTPNRADAVSHIGVARDLAAVLNAKGISNQLTKPNNENFTIDKKNTPIEIIVEDSFACPRYSGITIVGVEVKESPDWLKNRLKSIGLRPKNNIVDITNFVLHETGQPLHAFDAGKISGNKVIVKKLAQGTKFHTLDEVERELSNEDLMICNGSEGMCIAGVFGGISSGVNENTKSIFLESAYFDSVSIRKTSKFHGLKTDASFRYERGADPNITIYAAKRAASLIKEIAGGEITDLVDIYPKPIENFKVEINYSNVFRLIGKEIDKDLIKKILISLEIVILLETENGLMLSIPPFKVDVQREVDVIEEILRIYGYNNVETPHKIRLSLNNFEGVDREKMRNLVSDYLSSNSFSEIMCNSLTKSEYYQDNSLLKIENCVKILNPLSKYLDVMRQTLLYGGLETVSFNQNRKNFNLKLYEFGKSYHFYLEKDSSENDLAKYKEQEHLMLMVCGSEIPETWNSKERPTDFFFVKSFVMSILSRIGVKEKNIQENYFKNELFSEAIEINVNEKKVAEFGLLSSTLTKNSDIKTPVYYADLNWDALLKLSTKNKVKYTEIPKYPEVRRDLALLLDREIQFSEIAKLAKQTEKQLLRKVSLFDVYQGDKIDSGKKSYAVSFIIQDFEKTLQDKDIEKVMSKLTKAFEENLKAVIR
ncbi:MAG: phenylalanine--tRNA ligase subunit beta [Bacteroidetes bacterium]|nr:phenylalanine--tRNA ligase subunit beta [Bacteroidota bacterium]